VANQCASAIMQTRLLQDKLAAQEQLESRKLVERAKALLMKKRGLSEPDAFREIQKQSMDRRKSMKEIAEALLLGGRPRVIRLALAQINPTVGDLAGNAALVLRDARRAADAGADLAVFPEMALTGYPPEDLLLQPSFRVRRPKKPCAPSPGRCPGTWRW
jgi:hypothetical protein